MISQKSKYALRALLALARASGVDAVQTQDIADQARVPKRFLEHILLELKSHGLVASRRGNKGGYALLKSPETITFSQVLRIIDGPIAPLPCLSRTAYRRCADCPDETVCDIRRVFAAAYAATARVLDATTLADVLAESDKDRGNDGPATTLAHAFSGFGI